MFASGTHGEVNVKNAAKLPDRIGEFFNVIPVPLDHNHFGAYFMAEMQMGCGQNMLATVVLQLDQLLCQATLMMIENHGHSGNHLFAGLPLFIY
mgnify:CR=1 FL=1